LNDNGTTRFYGSSPLDYSTTVLADRAVAFIHGVPANQPMLLFFSPSAPHAPATPHPSDIGRFAGFPNWRPRAYNEPNVNDKPQFVRSLPLITTAKMATSDALHRRQLESLQSVDRAVAAIIAALQATDRWANTLFIFLSDNGLSWGEHRLLDRKSCPYEECSRVPFVIRVPGVPARPDTSLVANIDLAPTIAEWAGVTPPVNIDGTSLLGLLRDPATPWRTTLLIEQLGFAALHTDYQGVRTARYMYAEYQNGEAELYDLVTDPFQLTSVAKLASYSSIKSSLKAILLTLKAS
jgi:N-acetylglucosamine-6-sulfatase